MNIARISEWLDAERPVWVSGLIICAVMVALTGLRAARDPAAHPVQAGALIEAALMQFYLVLLIRYIRGPYRGDSFKPPYQKKRLGIWGYLWRAYVLLWLSILPVGFAVFRLAEDPAARYVVGTITTLIVPAALCWLLFGRERIQFVRRIVSYYR